MTFPSRRRYLFKVDMLTLDTRLHFAAEYCSLPLAGAFSPQQSEGRHYFWLSKPSIQSNIGS